MKLSLYLLPNKVGLRFDTTTDRDAFFARFPQKDALEKFGMRVIRFLPDKIKDPGWQTVIETGQQAQPPATPPTNPATVPKLTEADHLVNVASGDPFAITGKHVVKALPGLVAVKSNITEEPPVESVQPEPPAPAAAVEEPKVELPAADPEPSDKRTRSWREWKARQK
jgi:hypothetical protein